MRNVYNPRIPVANIVKISTNNLSFAMNILTFARRLLSNHLQHIEYFFQRYTCSLQILVFIYILTLCWIMTSVAITTPIVLLALMFCVSGKFDHTDCLDLKHYGIFSDISLPVYDDLPIFIILKKVFVMSISATIVHSCSKCIGNTSLCK